MDAKMQDDGRLFAVQCTDSSGGATRSDFGLSITTKKGARSVKEKA